MTAADTTATAITDATTTVTKAGHEPMASIPAETLRKVGRKLEDKLAKTGKGVGKALDKLKLTIRGRKTERANLSLGSC